MPPSATPSNEKGMIVGTHTIVQKLMESDFTFHLIGSRFLGVHYDHSDWDFYAEASYAELAGLIHWLERLGFKPEQQAGYGPDPALHAIMCWKSDSLPAGQPPVDVLIGLSDEIALRVRFLEELKGRGNDKGGKFCRAMKAEKAWPTLWVTLNRLEPDIEKAAK